MSQTVCIGKHLVFTSYVYLHHCKKFWRYINSMYNPKYDCFDNFTPSSEFLFEAYDANGILIKSMWIHRVSVIGVSYEGLLILVFDDDCDKISDTGHDYEFYCSSFKVDVSKNPSNHCLPHPNACFKGILT